MFIEKLWEENSESIINVVKKIYNIREERGDSLKFEKFEKGVLSFIKYGHDAYRIYLSDFWIGSKHCKPYKPDTLYAQQWLWFMCDAYGKDYIAAYTDFRQNHFKEFIQKYKEEYEDETNKVVAKLEENIQAK